ncbi:MAG: DNA polymerase sliding clamp [Acidilobaceae archaeon]
MVGLLLRLVYGKASNFKHIVQALAKVSDEGYLIFSRDGLKAWLMSPDKVSMAIVDVPPHSFEEYMVEEPLGVTVKVDELSRVVRRASANDSLTIELDSESENLIITLTDKKTGISRSFSIPLVSMKAEEPRELRLEPTTEITMDPEDLKILLQDAKIIGDTITFESKEDTLKVKVSGEAKEYEWELKPGEPLLSLEIEEPTTASYSRSSLEIATQPTTIAESVKLEYSTNYPLQISFNLPGGEKMIIYVAPILE